VETPGTAFDAVGAAALLELVGKKLGEKFDAKGLEAQARKAQAVIEKIERQAQAEAARAAASAPAQQEQKEKVSYIR